MHQFLKFVLFCSSTLHVSDGLLFCSSTLHVSDGLLFCSSTLHVSDGLLFCSSTLHVSDGISLHHQESKTVHTASGNVIQVMLTAC